MINFLSLFFVFTAKELASISGDKEETLMNLQLLKKGLRIETVLGDGNCLFRSFGKTLIVIVSRPAFFNNTEW